MEDRRRVEWTPAARSGLVDALDYIAADSPAAAQRVLEVVLEAADSLQILSERGRRVPDEAVQVVAFVHGARDLARLLVRGLDRP
jgi:plasmid stabilization system protein ParE